MESYRFGKRQLSHRKRYAVLLFVLIVLIAGGIFAAKHYFTSDTVISSPPPAVVSRVTATYGSTKRFNEGIFTISLPADWVFVSHQTAASNIYTWHNTAGGDPGVEQLQIYVDTIPANLGVNRVLPVQGNGNRVIPTEVSDNCADFTGDKVPGLPATPAKWDNINFLCDLANYERDVVGTSSSDGINVVKLTGVTTGRHNLFFAYTDNGSTPDFTIFTNAIQSFRLK
ncbi:MAG TPA: hypothetical protein VGG13_01190 [Candidatus Saccharimonadales bacterium]